MADSFQPRFVDLVRNYTSTEGTGNFVLGSAVTGYRSFGSAIQPGETFYYSAIGIEDPDEFEVGRGTMQPDGSISRDPIGGAFTSFSRGNKTLALVAAAEWFEGMQSGSTSVVGSAASRDAMAVMADPSKPVILHEQGRQGLFEFESSDLSKSVAIDAAQGVYVAPASDPTGAAGAWVRQYSGGVEARWFGAQGDGVADDTVAIQSAIQFVEAQGGGVLRLGNGTFSVKGVLMMVAPDVTVDARGATVSSADAAAKPMLYVGGDRSRLLGGTWSLTGGFDGTRAFDVEGVNCEIDGARIVKSPEAGGYHAYVRFWADGFVMRNCRTEGSNGIFTEASNSAFLSNSFVGRPDGGDDAIAIKAIQASTRGVRIIGNQFVNLANFCSIGSEIGSLRVDDPTYSHVVVDIVVTGNRGSACSGIVSIKPGAISVYDYRDGVVGNVTISDNVLEDMTGAKFSRGIAITPARGAKVRNISGKGNIVRARVNDTTGRAVGAVDLYISNLPGGTSEASITDVDLEVLFDDPFDGKANDASRPGYPAGNIVAASLVDPLVGSMSNIRLQIRGNGCAGSGVSIGAGLDDALHFESLVLTNCCSALGSAAGLFTDSRVRIERAKIGTFGSPAYKLGASGEIVGQVSNTFLCEQISAGNDGARRPWAAPVRCFVTKVEMLSDIGIDKSADDTNYTKFEFRNLSGTGNIFQTANSSFSTGQAFPANSYNSLLLSKTISNPVTQADCFFAKDGVLMINKNDFGTGNTVRNAYLRVHWAPY